jgi:prepilin-type N-terminal cleavage/methylation domain-containing protein
MIQYFTKLMRNTKGFTLVELMVVVAIIGVLTAIAIPVYNAVTDRAEEATIKANLRTIDSALMQYYTLESGKIPEIRNIVPAYIQAWPGGEGDDQKYFIGTTQDGKPKAYIIIDGEKFSFSDGNRVSLDGNGELALFIGDPSDEEK